MPDGPRNILLLIADDLGLMAGCYGDPCAHTPNLDALAASGIRFSHAFTSTASCSGSRSVIYSGLHTHQSGQYGLNHDRHHFQTFPDVATAPACLAAAGHATGIIGKVHVGPDPVYPWQWRDESWGRDVDWMARRTGAFLDATRGRPFFLTLGFIDPHRDATRAGFGAPDGPDPVFRPGDVTVPPFLSDLPEVRRELASYHHAIARMDRGVGLALAELAQRGVLDDTLVIFLSDNGAPFLNSKATLFDSGIHLPLIVSAPGHAGGIVNPNLVSFTDILPTLLDWAGAPAPADGRHRDGRSLLPILDSTTRHPDRDRVAGSHTFHEITNYWPTRFLRTGRYKYHRNVAWQLPFPISTDILGSLSFEAMRGAGRAGNRTLADLIHRPAEELYDLAEDPHETCNIAARPENAALTAGFRAELEAWQRRTDDPWLLRDGASVIALEDHVAEGLTLGDGWDLDVTGR